MRLRSFSILLFVLLVLSQAGLALWRYLPIEPSTAAVFSYPPATANFGDSETLVKAIQEFGCDRGAEWSGTSDDGTQISLMYFESDAIQDQALRDVALHRPEVCNERPGFKLKQAYANRVYHPSGQKPLIFDSTCFSTSSDKEVFIFKLVWEQGRGSVEFRDPTGIRMERLKTSFQRQHGAARVLQAAVSDARDADHAWQTFQSVVLEKLEWR